MNANAKPRFNGLVSVVVPVRDARRELPGLLEALGRQTLAASEILFVDDASSDGTAGWLEKHLPSNARLLRSETAGNPYAARNVGVRAARGGWLAFTDADCRPAPEWLEQGVAALRDTVTVAGRIVVERSDPTSLVQELDARRFLRQERFVQESFAATANLFVRRQVFDEVGLFDERLVSGGDQEFGARANAAGLPLAFAEHAVVHHPARRNFGALLGKAHRVGVGFGQSLRHHPSSTRACERIVDRLSLLRSSWQSPTKPLSQRVALVGGMALLAAGTAVGCTRGYFRS